MTDGEPVLAADPALEDPLLAEPVVEEEEVLEDGEYSKSQVMEANIRILSMLGVSTAYFVFNQFYFTTGGASTIESAYATMVSGGTNWWSTAKAVKNYGGLALFGTLLITQILSMAGLFNTINMSLFDMTTSWLSPLIMLVFFVFAMLAEQAAVGQRNDATNSATASDAHNFFASEVGGFLALIACARLVIGNNYDIWMYGQEISAAAAESKQAQADAEAAAEAELEGLEGEEPAEGEEGAEEAAEEGEEASP